MNKATTKEDCVKFRRDFRMIHYGPLFNDLMVNGSALEEIEKVLVKISVKDRGVVPSCVHTIIGESKLKEMQSNKSKFCIYTGAIISGLALMVGHYIKYLFGVKEPCPVGLIGQFQFGNGGNSISGV